MRDSKFSDPDEVYTMIAECESPFSAEEQEVLLAALNEGTILTVTEYLYHDLIETVAWFPESVWREIKPWEKLPRAKYGKSKSIGGVISMARTVYQLFIWWGDALPDNSWTGMVLAKGGVTVCTAPNTAHRFYSTPKWDDRGRPGSDGKEW